ncbi:MAG: DUF814 domain-containing protein [Proteobacteria bacterium]|nr:DUF814 domain-containing protein [Pseudomonadota bacterium]
MNYAELKHIVEHLNFVLHMGVIEQISDGNCTLQLGFRKYTDGESNRRTFIVLDFKASHLDIYPTQHPRKAPAVPQAFTMLLRKYLKELHVTGIRLAQDDRVVFFDFSQESEPQFSLIAEYTGNAPKIFLIDAENQLILGMIGDDEERTIHSEYIRPESNLTKTGTDRFESQRGAAYEQALEDYYTLRNRQEEFEEIYSAQNKRLKKSIVKNDKLIGSLNSDLDKVELAKREQKEADILNAYAWQVRKGASSADLPDFETGAPVHIALDPSLSVRGNIDRMYNHAKRMLKAQPQIEARLLKALQRQEVLKKMQEQLTPCANLEELHQYVPILDKLCAQDEKKRTSNQPQRETAQVKAAVHQPYKAFQAADGTRILVGKTASDNDDLTFHHARGNDTWLHVSQVPGSHVVVKHPNPSQETLLDAALLAMHYSKMAQNSAAEVHVTQVKYVRKIKGAPAGKVEIRGEKAIHVRRDEKRLARLLATLES